MAGNYRELPVTSQLSYIPHMPYNQLNRGTILDESKRRYQYKGKGSYGVVYTNTQSNSPSIIKRYFYPEDLREADTKSRTFATMSGNSKVAGIRENVQSTNLSNMSPPSYSISILRMPYFGENFFNVIDSKKTDEYIRKITSQPDYITKILHSIQLLLQYTANIAANGYCHGDMHMDNIMIEPSTCEMHMIDFDFFQPFDTYTKLIIEGARKNLFHYMIPPEYLFLRIMKPDEISYEQIKIHHANNKYAELPIIRNYLFYFMNVPPHHDDKILINAPDVVDAAHIAYINECNQNNFTYFMELKDQMKEFNFLSLISSQFMQYFDNFGLGMGLQFLLYRIYNNSHPPEKIKATLQLLKQMSSFTIKERPTPKEAYDKMTEIISQKGGRRKTVRRNRHRRKTHHKKRKQ